MQLFEISYAYKFLGGFYLALSVLHAILFLYNRSRKANLVYAAGMFLVFINFTFTQQAQLWSGAYKANILTDLAANGALLFYVSKYAISRALPSLIEVLRIFGWLYAAGFILLVINFQLDIFSTPLEILLRSAIYGVIGACCIIGLVKKIANFHLIVLATLFLMVMWVFFGTDIFSVWRGNFPPIRVIFILIGFILPGLAYSYYLSQYLFRTKKNLEREQVINEQLTLINIQAEKIKELDQLKSRFFANISHEFRTPLTLILAPLEKKLKEAHTREEKADFSLIHRSASRLLTLVNQLLDLSRLEAGTLKLNMKHTDLGKFVTTITSQFASIADSKKINFQVNLSETIELFIDHDKLEKIVTNLLSNAFKFTPAHGTITLSIQTGSSNETFPDGYAEIIVSDTGKGIAARHLDNIFDRFYQVDNSAIRESEGAGIGLALTKELVELHKGTIAVLSEVGKGTTFIVHLPLGFLHLKADELTLEAHPMNQPPEYAEFEQEENSSLKSDATTEKILVIEDNADLRQFIRSELSKTFSVLEAADGEEGLASAFEHIPTLIITDLMMPKRDGLQLCAILKNDERTSHIPVILLTAKADVETKLQGLQTGADEYIPKPFNLEELNVRITNLIEIRNRLREKYMHKLALRPAEIKVESVDERFLKNIMQVVEAHISDSAFGVEQFAYETGMSQAQLYRKLHALTGFTPNELVRDMRLQRAADLFQQHAGNVADVAYQVGFNNLSYFAKCFKEKFAESPSQFLSRIK
jgi:signal transduction histidine kinase/AraC-like DNA-binding protein